MNPSVTSDYANYLKLTGNETAAASLTLSSISTCRFSTLPNSTNGRAPVQMQTLIARARAGLACV
jgi:hypothetical protein